MNAVEPSRPQNRIWKLTARDEHVGPERSRSYSWTHSSPDLRIAGLPADDGKPQIYGVDAELGLV